MTVKLKLPDTSNLSNDKFYVYIDYKPDGTPFYIGISSGLNRLLGSGRYGRYHTNICNKYECYRLIEFISDNRNDVLNKEIELIAEYGTINEVRGVKLGSLLNRSSGGEGGASGYIQTKEHKEKIRICQLKSHSKNPDRSELLRNRSIGNQFSKEYWSNPINRTNRSNKLLALYETKPELKVLCSKHAWKKVSNDKGEVFESAREASRKIGLNDRAVTNAIRAGVRAGGFYWSYANE